MFFFLLTSCCTKAGNMENTKIVEFGKEESGVVMVNEQNKLYCFIDSIKPAETIVEERKMQDGKAVIKKNTNIHVYFLLLDSLTRDGFLTVEIVNYTNNKIHYASDSFFFYKESNDSWASLPYPENYFKTDLGYFIPPQKSIRLRLFLPLQKDHFKGKYKLQLIFYNTSQETYYYIDKFFLIK